MNVNKDWGQKLKRKTQKNIELKICECQRSANGLKLRVCSRNVCVDKCSTKIERIEDGKLKNVKNEDLDMQGKDTDKFKEGNKGVQCAKLKRRVRCEEEIIACMLKIIKFKRRYG